MSVRRALVDCVVLSLQDACLFYPCCKLCFSKIDVEQHDTTRCRCSRCGYMCPREHVDHRYRLSLKVARDRYMFGVTVFGACLNPFFGIDACGLHRLVENAHGPFQASSRSTLLAKAVTDCFIGRHFIFGIKITETQSVPWLREPDVKGSNSGETDQFIASQMILPDAPGLGGCTVVSYYRILLQKAAEHERDSTDPSKAPRHPATTLLLMPCLSPVGSWNSATQYGSGLSQSLQRSQNQDCTLTPTPPWRQSLGLVTSSAEQAEDCSTQDSGHEDSRQTEDKDAPRRSWTGCLQYQKVPEGGALSPLPSIENRSYSSPSFVKYPHSSIEKAVGNTLFSPSPPGLCNSKEKRFSTGELTKTFYTSSLDWEDLPFSESLTEFLCVENRDVDIVGESEPVLNQQNQKETARTNLEASSSTESPSVCRRDAQMTDSQSRISVAITNNTPALNGAQRHDLPDQLCKNHVDCVNNSQPQNIWSSDCHREEKKATSLLFERDGEEQLKGDTYNCSADLFGSSLVMDTSAHTLDTHAQTAWTTTEACPVLLKTDRQNLRREKASVPHSTPVKQKQKSNRCFDRDSFIPPGTQEFDFIPPSQSTPIVKVLPESPALYRSFTLGESTSRPGIREPCAMYRKVPKLDVKKPAKITSPLCKLKSVGSNQVPECVKPSSKENLTCCMASSALSHRLTPKKGFWKPDKIEGELLGPHPLGRALNINRRVDHESADCDVTVCDNKEEVTLVPPTPAAKTWPSVNLRRKRPGLHRGGGVLCKIPLLDGTSTTPRRSLAQRGNRDGDTGDEGDLDGSYCHLLSEESQACDWSRDLFSDSV